MKLLNSLLIMIIIFSFAGSSVYAQTSDYPEGGSDAGILSLSADIQYNTLYASAYNELWSIDTTTGTATYIGFIGYPVTDVAFHLGTLYGITFSQLIQIDPETGAGTVIGNMGFSDVNGLTISRDGTGYATTIGGNLLRVDITTGEATLIGFMGDGYHSDGDVAISDDDKIYVTIFTSSDYYSSWLAYLDRETGAATPILRLGYDEVWGISFKDGILYGVTRDGFILTIDPHTKEVTQIGSSTAEFYGLSTSGPAIIGEITSPPDNYTTGPASVPFEATAGYPGGPGISQVEFYAYSSVEWRPYGNDKTAPYAVAWTPPVELTTQQVLLRIDVVGTDLARVNYAGGVRRLNYIQSLGNPDMVENWVGNRAYLSQRSLGDNGDVMCGATSMAMVLAMEDYIDHDYRSMANKAGEMHPRVWTDAGAVVHLMRTELQNQGAAGAVYFGYISNDRGWELLTNYINAGHPLILRTEHGVLTEYGHYIVAVGYQESGNNRTVIAYDPFGMWKGLTCAQRGTVHCTNNYYTNMHGDPTSHVGQWVFYDFDTVFGNYLIAATPPVCAQPGKTASPQDECRVIETGAVPSSPPDMISDEPRVTGTNPGIEYGEPDLLFIPAIKH